MRGGRRDAPGSRPLTRRALVGAALAVLGAPRTVGAMIAADDPRLRTATVRQRVSPGRTLALYMALPARARGKHAAVLVLHGARGLDGSARAIVRQIALLGYVACAPDLLSRAGGTPPDATAAHAAIAALDLDQATLDAVATVRWLGINPPGEQILTGRVGAIGFGWGGALATRVAGVSGTMLSTVVDYYGAPVTATEAAGVRAATMMHLAADDAATDARAAAWSDALRSTGVPIETFTYLHTSPGFAEEDAPAFDPVAAALAWERTTDFLARTLR